MEAGSQGHYAFGVIYGPTKVAKPRRDRINCVMTPHNILNEGQVDVDDEQWKLFGFEAWTEFAFTDHHGILQLENGSEERALCLRQ